MNILLWILQVAAALVCANGAVWRSLNWKQIEKMPSTKALPRWMWNALNLLEVLCSLGLVLPGAFKVGPVPTAAAASILAVELLLMTGLHVRHNGWRYRASNPAAWSFTLAALCAFIAYGRSVLKPF